MTRFARAKGSKSSNEKKPEEATSWSEMKNSILSKKTKQPEKPVVTEVKIEAPKKTEWASLGDDGSCESMLKPNAGKKGSGKVKKEIKLENGLSIAGDESSKKKKIKKEKSSGVSDINENRINKKKGNKRKSTEDVGSEQPKKKQKLPQTENSDLNENAKNRKLKKAKAKNMRNENQFRNFNSKGDKRQFDKGRGKKKFKNEGNYGVEELIINGEKIKIVKFQGFYVTLDDAERLKKLRLEMIKEGIPKAKLEAAIKLERRRAEKALSRLKKSVCFHCRGHGHLLSNCPELIEKENTGTGICYKCGSTEHSAAECKVVKGTEFKFAECFICKEQGHIARQCPDNPRGLYPQGGACRECGDVTHLRKDCPKVQAQKAEEVVTVGLRNDRDLECLDEEITSREKIHSEKKVKKNTTVKF